MGGRCRHVVVRTVSSAHLLGYTRTKKKIKLKITDKDSGKHFYFPGDSEKSLVSTVIERNQNTS